MSIKISHIRMEMLDNDGNENVLYPENTQHDVLLTEKLTEINPRIPDYYKTLNDLLSQLGSLFFSDTQINDESESDELTWSSSQISSKLNELHDLIINECATKEELNQMDIDHKLLINNILNQIQLVIEQMDTQDNELKNSINDLKSLLFKYIDIVDLYEYNDENVESLKSSSVTLHSNSAGNTVSSIELSSEDGITLSTNSTPRLNIKGSTTTVEDMVIGLSKDNKYQFMVTPNGNLRLVWKDYNDYFYKIVDADTVGALKVVANNIDDDKFDSTTMIKIADVTPVSPAGTVITEGLYVKLVKG